jgi:hypothetical protein
MDNPDFLGTMLATVRESHTTPDPHPSRMCLDCLGILLTGTYSFTDRVISASDFSTEAISTYLAAPHKTTINPTCSPRLDNAFPNGESCVESVLRR